MMEFEIGVSLSPERSPFGPLLYSGKLARGMRMAGELGYHCIELSLRDSSEIDSEGLSSDLSRSKLRVAAIATGQSYYNDGYSLYDADAVNREQAVSRIKGHVGLAKRLGAAVILGGIRGRIGPVEEAARAQQLRHGREALAACAKYAAEIGVMLLLEPINRYETDVVNTVADALAVIEEIGSDALKVLPDTFHMNIEEPSIPDSIRRCGRQLGYIHMADSNRWAPGFGHIDFAAVAAALAQIGYRGPWGVEVLPKPSDYEAAVQAIRHLAQVTQRV